MHAAKKKKKNVSQSARLHLFCRGRTSTVKVRGKHHFFFANICIILVGEEGRRRKEGRRGRGRQGYL